MHKTGDIGQIMNGNIYDPHNQSAIVMFSDDKNTKSNNWHKILCGYGNMCDP